MKSKSIPDHQLRRLESISSLLLELRLLNKGMTQQLLSENLNLCRNTIVRAENAKNITLISLFELVDAHNISLRDLFMDID